MDLELASERESENDSERALAGGLGSIELLEKVVLTLIFKFYLIMIYNPVLYNFLTNVVYRHR
jgi:hypothetical protein